MKIILTLIIILTFNRIFAQATFLECPDKPNCIVTMKDKIKRESQFIEPIIINNTDQKEIIYKLVTIIRSDAKAEIVKHNLKSIKVEYTSSFFKFVDDLEIKLFPSENNTTIHIRSASRTGYYDFDANKKRVLNLKTAINKNFN